MAVVSGTVSVAASAVKLCTMGPAGALVQNLGTVVVTLGGPGIAVGSGPTLPASMTSPVLVPGGSVDPVQADVAAVTDDLYAIGASAGPTSVVFLTNV